MKDLFNVEIKLNSVHAKDFGKPIIFDPDVKIETIKLDEPNDHTKELCLWSEGPFLLTRICSR